MLFLNRSFWPDTEATGQLLTELCEDLAADYDVAVVAGQPNRITSQEAYRRVGVQSRRGVEVRRVPHTRFAKRSVWGRAVNFLSYLVMAWCDTLWIRRPDVVVVETDPFVLAFLGAWLKFRYRSKLIVYLQDVYPDVAVALGKLRDGLIVRALRAALVAVYRRADRVVVLSKDMKMLLCDRGVDSQRIVCIPNWADTAELVPQKTQNRFRQRELLNGHFVVMYSGNMGLTQRLDKVLEAAEGFRTRDDVVFLFVGDGVSKNDLERRARERRLPNVRFLPYQAKSELSHSLSAADLHLLPLNAPLASCLMPSKLYGILASGTAVLTDAPPESEIRQLVESERVGLTVPPGDANALADGIRWGLEHRHELEQMGFRARRLAEARFDRKQCTGRFGALLTEVLREI